MIAGVISDPQQPSDCSTLSRESPRSQGRNNSASPTAIAGCHLRSATQICATYDTIRCLVLPTQDLCDHCDRQSLKRAVEHSTGTTSATGQSVAGNYFFGFVTCTIANPIYKCVYLLRELAGLPSEIRS
jgi:hypothetical protein